MEDEVEVSNCGSENMADNESEVDTDGLSESSIESDEESDIDSEPHTKTRAEHIRETIEKKYNELKGKQLYVRFPQKLPLDEEEFEQKIKKLFPLITKAHKPRQKHARFCLIDFQSKEDRDKALKKIKSSTENDAAYKGIIVSIPKTESDEFISHLVERKQKSVENKKAKVIMKRATKQALRSKNFTSSIVVTNLPKTSSIVQLRNLFPGAVDIHVKPGKGKRRDTSIATITLPSTKDARVAVKQKVAIDGNELVLRFNTQLQKRRKKKNVNLKPTTLSPNST